MTLVVPSEGAVPCFASNVPATPPPTPVEILPGVATFPLVSRVAVADGVWIACAPPPVTRAVLVRLPAPTTVTVPPPPPPQDEPEAKQIAPVPETARPKAVATPVPRPVIPPTATADAVDAFPARLAVIVDPEMVGVVEVQPPAPSSTRIFPAVLLGIHPLPPPPPVAGTHVVPSHLAIWLVVAPLCVMKESGIVFGNGGGGAFVVTVARSTGVADIGTLQFCVVGVQPDGAVT